MTIISGTQREGTLVIVIIQPVVVILRDPGYPEPGLHYLGHVPLSVSGSVECNV